MSTVPPVALETYHPLELSLPEPSPLKQTTRRRHNRKSTLPLDKPGFFASTLEEQWKVYLECMRLFEHSASVKIVHDLRVSMRRLMTRIELVERFSPDRIIGKARATLKNQLSELSELRDVQVEIVRTRKILKSLPEITEFYDHLLQRKSDCLNAARKISSRPDKESLENAINRTLIRLNSRQSNTTEATTLKVIDDALQSCFDRLSKRIQAVTLAKYSTVHKVRLAFKPFRYMLEMVQPVLPIDPKKLQTAKTLARMMGRLQDMNVMTKDLVEFKWKTEQARNGIAKLWLDLEHQKSEAANQFQKALPKFGEIWKPITQTNQATVKATQLKTLYLLRHGLAGKRGDPAYPVDADRPLTPKGIKKMRAEAKGMRRMNIEFDVILTSPYRRALETAFIVARELRIGESLQTCSALRAEGPPEEVVQVLQSKYAPCKSVLLVGHEPQLSTLVSTLTSGDIGSGPTMKKGGLCKLQISKLRAGKSAMMLWLLTPRQLSNIA